MKNSTTDEIRGSGKAVSRNSKNARIKARIWKETSENATLNACPRGAFLLEFAPKAGMTAKRGEAKDQKMQS
jgi:hypothetical protein